MCVLNTLWAVANPARVSASFVVLPQGRHYPLNHMLDCLLSFARKHLIPLEHLSGGIGYL